MRNFKQPQKVKTSNKCEQDLFLGHTNALQQIPTVALPGLLGWPREAGGLQGRMATGRQDSHTAEHTPATTPDSTAELALCRGGTQRKVIQADIIQKLPCQ